MLLLFNHHKATNHTKWLLVPSGAIICEMTQGLHEEMNVKETAILIIQHRLVLQPFQMTHQYTSPSTSKHQTLKQESIETFSHLNMLSTSSLPLTRGFIRLFSGLSKVTIHGFIYLIIKKHAYSLCLICSLQSINHMQEISTEVSVLGGVVFASDAAAFGGVAPKSKSAKGSFFGGYPPVADGGVALVLSWK